MIVYYQQCDYLWFATCYTRLPWQCYNLEFFSTACQMIFINIWIRRNLAWRLGRASGETRVFGYGSIPPFWCQVLWISINIWPWRNLAWWLGRASSETRIFGYGSIPPFRCQVLWKNILNKELLYLRKLLIYCHATTRFSCKKTKSLTVGGFFYGLPTDVVW